jgi:hypothetical protein
MPPLHGLCCVLDGRNVIVRMRDCLRDRLAWLVLMDLRCRL